MIIQGKGHNRRPLRFGEHEAEMVNIGLFEEQPF